MTYLLYIVFCLLVLVFQTTLSMHFAMFSGIYDLFLLFVIYLGFYRTVREGFPFVILFGLSMDALSAGPFGLYLTSYFWLYMCILGLTLFMRVSNNMILPLVVMGSILFQNIIFLGTMTLFVPEATIPVISYRNILSQSLWSIITGPVLILLFRRAHVALEKWLKTFQPEYG
jgi:cell shape-determining protein MreD